MLAIIKGIFEMVSLIRQALELYRKAKLEGWLDDGKQILDKISNAKSDEERAKLVRDLNSHYHGG